MTHKSLLIKNYTVFQRLNDVFCYYLSSGMECHTIYKWLDLSELGISTYKDNTE